MRILANRNIFIELQIKQPVKSNFEAFFTKPFIMPKTKIITISNHFLQNSIKSTPLDLRLPMAFLTIFQTEQPIWFDFNLIMKKTELIKLYENCLLINSDLMQTT